ncbi:MAG: hypothetical protein HQL03_06030 [Nitrospirae bacterium]|nr:hypothetical protein [Nitrospirota bacterium]MBF0592504.1 hypothetical protein [Nitrospirota bacterium]
MNVSSFNNLQQTASVYQGNKVSNVNRVSNTTGGGAKANAPARGQDKVTISAEARSKYAASVAKTNTGQTGGAGAVTPTGKYDQGNIGSGTGTRG